jgi:hypothetical protein
MKKTLSLRDRPQPKAALGDPRLAKRLHGSCQISAAKMCGCKALYHEMARKHYIDKKACIYTQFCHKYRGEQWPIMAPVNSQPHIAAIFVGKQYGPLQYVLYSTEH